LQGNHDNYNDNKDCVVMLLLKYLQNWTTTEVMTVECTWDKGCEHLGQGLD